MVLRREEIERLAILTRLELSQEEQKRLGGELGAILEYVDRLAKVDTSGVPETETRTDVFFAREDVSETPSKETRAIILQNFPDTLGDALRVPAVFENPKK